MPIFDESATDILRGKFERYVQMFPQLDAEACKQEAADQCLNEDQAAFWNVALSVAVAAVNNY